MPGELRVLAGHPGRGPSWARRKSSALPPPTSVFPPPRAMLPSLENKPKGVLAAGKTLDSRVGWTWVQILAPLWELGHVTLPL